MGIFSAPPDGTSDPILTRMVAEDKVIWYKKPNLRKMYFILFFCCMGVEMTSGFDSQLINTLQFSQKFNECMYSNHSPPLECADGAIDFGGGEKDRKTNKFIINAGLLGFISSCYQLGSILAVPIAPWINQKFGRRWSIMIGSLIMCVGALIQGFSQHGTYSQDSWSGSTNTTQLLCISLLVCCLVSAFCSASSAVPPWSESWDTQRRELPLHPSSTRLGSSEPSSHLPLLSRQWIFLVIGVGESLPFFKFAPLFSKSALSCKFLPNLYVLS